MAVGAYMLASGAPQLNQKAYNVQHLDPGELSKRLIKLQGEHRVLDERIAAMVEEGCDDLELKRLKKRKLQLKDSIAKVQSMLIPDLDA